MRDIDILILTHCHFDHSAMAKDLQDKTGCEIWMSQEEAEFFEEDRAESSASMRSVLSSSIRYRFEDIPVE
jgi:glyoxylase-like metal-dependent hydrolase (beta-lactamase superfamily II)